MPFAFSTNDELAKETVGSKTLGYGPRLVAEAITSLAVVYSNVVAFTRRRISSFPSGSSKNTLKKPTISKENS